MQVYTENAEIRQGRKTLLVSKYYNKFSSVALWRVSYKLGAFFYILRDGLKNKPNAKQIARYFEMI